MDELEKQLLESVEEATEFFKDPYIRFWRTRDEYGCFSNFSKHPIKYHGVLFSTSEHLYQALKMTNPEDMKRVREAKTPKESKTIAYECDMREDWDEVKFTIMIDILRLKVAQHPEIKKKLSETGQKIIQEASPYDYIWGTGKDGSGLNLLGKAWMQVRKETN